MHPFSRRAFLLRAGTVGAAALASTLWTPSYRRALARSLAISVNPAGTTLERSLVYSGEGYLRISYGPGWPIVVREELAPASAGREDRRVALASVVHLTDLHLLDAESPARVDFWDRYSDGTSNSFIPFQSAFRAQETLSNQVGEAMIQQINAIAAGPVTGRPFDCAVSTGDNIDNQQVNETDWFIRLLDGGELTPTSGDLTRYEGVQDNDLATYDSHFWHPDPPPSPRDPDFYKRYYGFPEYPGLLDASGVPFVASGLDVPWYSTYGNHDGLVQGNVKGNPAIDAIATGRLKPTALPPGASTGDLENAFANGDPTLFVALLSGPARVVTADPDRRSLSTGEWVAKHLASTGGPGPSGHGYTEEDAANGDAHFAFQIAEGVLGISLDTCNWAYADGSVGEIQMAWAEQRIQEVSSRYFDSAGTEVTSDVADQLVILFSHHGPRDLTSPVPNPMRPTEARLLQPEILEILHRYPNVIAWMNGHSHRNLITPQADPTGLTGGFWDIATAAHIDFPEHARLVEVVDNRDGTLSIFATLIDHAATLATPPPGTPAASFGPEALAALGREFAYNDPQVGIEDGAEGRPRDRNVELLLPDPRKR